MKMIKKNTVLVTGANGYVASWLVKKLIEEGYTVHATVRDKNDKSKVDVLKALVKEETNKLKIFEADLLVKNSFNKAMEGCSVVFHTASPFKLDIKDPKKELINPALLGQKMFKFCNNSDSVKKVVLTSSVAAMYSDASECLQYENNEITESVWNNTASLDYQPYSFSKTIAEKSMGNKFKQEKWDLIVINPSLVLGPFLNGQNVTSESFKILKQIGDGTFKNGFQNGNRFS